MLSKKRPILFEVMGHRGRAAGGRPARETPAPRARAKAASRERPNPFESPVVRWAALAVVVVVAITFAVWRLQRPSPAQIPQLQTNVSDDARGGAESPGKASAHAFTICVLEKPYKTLAERKLAREKVEEIVNFLGYDSDPVFRQDVRAKDFPSKESGGAGAFRIYVGSADRKPELIPLRDKLAAVVYKKTQPFRNASIRMVER
jgi:hypothetical protein